MALRRDSMNIDGRGVRTAVGFGIWLIGLVALPAGAPLQARILLLAPLVVVPLLLDAVPRPVVALPVNGWQAFAAAAPLVAALSFAPGPVAAALAVPWLLFSGLMGIAAASRGLRRLPGILAPRRASELGFLAAAGFLGVAGLFLFFDRLGVQPGGFSPEIILLTAVHFHFAGFGLLLVASLLAVSRPRVGIPVLGLLVGIPLTAAGFVTGSTALNAVGGFVTGASGIGIAIALLLDRSLLSVPKRIAFRLAGLALLIGMPMGIAWSVAIAMGGSFLNLDAMVRTHGALNATAVILVALAVPRSETR